MGHQHTGLSIDRWRLFPLPHQILMIGNEMNRTKRLFSPLDMEGLKRGLERILYLLDLTISIQHRHAFQRELLRVRGLIAEQYLLERMDVDYYRKIFKVLLLLHPESAEQIPFVCE